MTTLIVGPALIALLLVRLHSFLRSEGSSRPAALAIVAATGLCTPLVVYSKTIFPQVFEAAFLMWAFERARAWRANPVPRVAWQVGLAAGLAVASRTAFAPAAVCFAVYLLFAGSMTWRMRVGSLIQFAWPLALGVAVPLGVNWLRWGSCFDFGYHSQNESFSTSPLLGITGLLFSPGKGLLVYAPLILIPLSSLAAIDRRGRAELSLAIGITLVYLAIYGRWYDWYGGMSWGPRFLIPLIAPWMALAGRGLAECARWRWRLFAACAGIGCGVQFLGLFVNPHWIYRNGDPDPFAWREGYLVQTWRELIARGIDDLWIFDSRQSDCPIWLPLSLALLAAAAIAARRVVRAQLAA